MRVQDVMTRSVVSVRPDTPLREVARLLDEQRISGLLVTDTRGALLGVVPAADFLVEVQGGASVSRSPIARLFGRSGDAGALGNRRSSAEMIARTAVLLPGVRDVKSEAHWTIDDAALENPTPARSSRTARSESGGAGAPSSRRLAAQDDSSAVGRSDRCGCRDRHPSS